MKYISLIALFTLVFISACQEDPTSVGKNLIPDEDKIQVTEINSLDDSLAQSSFYYYDRSVSYGSSIRTLLGRYENMEASVLMSFLVNLPDSVISAFQNDSLIIKESTVLLTPTYYLGDKNLPLDFTVHKINSTWGPTGFNKDSLSFLEYSNQNLGSNIQIDDSTLSFNLDQSIVSEWISKRANDNEPTNNGIYLKPTLASQRVVGLLAFTNFVNEDELPKIRVVVEKPNKFVDTLFFSDFTDVHVVEGQLPNLFGNDDLVLQAGIATRAITWFDFSKIPVNSIINSVELELTVDSTNSLFGNLVSDSLLVRLVADSTAKTLSDSTLQTILGREGNKFKGEIRQLAQRINDGYAYQGFRLNLFDEDRTLTRFVIKGSNTPIEANRPKITIYYSNR